MEEIKVLFWDLILLGHVINDMQLTTMLSLLHDKSFEDTDYSSVELNDNTLFVQKSVPYFFLAKKQLDNNEDITQIDLFIDLYKQLLLKDEHYELLAYLKL